MEIMFSGVQRFGNAPSMDKEMDKLNYQTYNVTVTNLIYLNVGLVTDGAIRMHSVVTKTTFLSNVVRCLIVRHILLLINFKYNKKFKNSLNKHNTNIQVIVNLSDLFNILIEHKIKQLPVDK